MVRRGWRFLNSQAHYEQRARLMPGSQNVQGRKRATNRGTSGYLRSHLLKIGSWPPSLHQWSERRHSLSAQNKYELATPRSTRERKQGGSRPSAAFFYLLKLEIIASWRIMRSRLHLTLPLSGRLRDLAISADSTVACPIEGLVRRCRFFKGKHGRPLPRQQRSSHLRFTSHTCAQLQSKSRDDLQDGVKAGVGCCQALAGVLAPGIIERSTRHEALVRYKSSGRSEYRTENLAAYLISAEVLICCPAVVIGDVSLVEVE